MEGALLGYLLGLGTVVAIAKRGNKTRALVAWTARQAGFVSGKVTKALTEASAVARDEYQRARLANSGEAAVESPPAVPREDEHSQLSARYSGN
jgi:hypothetical protein